MNIGDFGVAHLFETCADAEQDLYRQLPQTTHPINLLTRKSTGLLDNTAGSMYFYPPESTLEKAYNTYAADVEGLKEMLTFRSGVWVLLFTLWWSELFQSTIQI